jgi:hypothetical protein
MERLNRAVSDMSHKITSATWWSHGRLPPTWQLRAEWWLLLHARSFAMENARHDRTLDDVTYVAGNCFRSVACLCQVLFAINSNYLLNEKGAVLGTQRLMTCPKGFSTRVASALQQACNAHTALAVQELLLLVICLAKKALLLSTSPQFMAPGGT